jgi:hypothetical protein
MVRRGAVAVGLVGGLLASARPVQAQDVRTTVTGTVYDSVGKRQLDSAVVQLVRADRPGEGRTVMADANGRFRFDDVTQGSWILGFLHPVLDSLGLPTPMLHVRVRDPEPIRAMLAVPSAASIVRSVCGVSADSGGLWFGYTRSAVDGRPVPGTTVHAQWSRIHVVGKSLQRDLPEVAGPSGEDGVFRQCYMPADEIVIGRAWRDADSSGVVTFTMPPSGLLRRDIYVGPVNLVETRLPLDSLGSDSGVVVPVRTGSGRLVGRVTNPGGRPIKGARLRFIETGAQAVANDEGYFGIDSLPLGSFSVDARAIGHVSALQPVDIVAGPPATANIVLANRKVYLDTVKVVGRRVVDSQQHLDFLRRKRQGFGSFFDEAELEKRPAMYLTDYLRMTPGVRVFDRGRILFRSMGFSQYCSPTLFLDRMRIGEVNELGIDALVSPQDVIAMEVYSRPTQVPAEFQTLDGCGAIVVWTGRRSRPPA